MQTYRHLAIDNVHCLLYNPLHMNVINGSVMMKEILTTITRSGQVTVPAEVRRLLGAKAGDKLAFQIEGDEIRLAPAVMTLESAYRSIKPLAHPEDFKRIEEMAKEEHVARTLAKMRDA